MKTLMAAKVSVRDCGSTCGSCRYPTASVPSALRPRPYCPRTVLVSTSSGRMIRTASSTFAFSLRMASGLKEMGGSMQR